MAKLRKSDFRPARAWIDRLPAASNARAQAGARQIIEATHLAQVRKALTVTQADLAKRAGLKQAEVSRIENNVPTIQIQTLERYVEGLGGTVRIVADFPDGSYAEIPLRAGRPVKSRATVTTDQDKESV